MSDWLGAPPSRVGEISVAANADGGVALCHRDDATRDDLQVSTTAEAAIEIARFDDRGAYRPLKTAPNLRHGWQLVLCDRNEALRALDHFYPGRAAAYRAWQQGALRTTPLRETLARQSGMYRVAAKVTDAQADEVVANVCRSNGGCLRTIFWKRDVAGSPPSDLLPATKFDPQFDQTGRSAPTLPLLCQEACNILVGAIRDAVKA